MVVRRIGRILVESGARVDIPNGQGFTVLKYAASRKPEFLKMLIEAGVKVDEKEIIRSSIPSGYALHHLSQSTEWFAVPEDFPMDSLVR